jgi:nucleotide-binding universal stress UspA family protein
MNANVAPGAARAATSGSDLELPFRKIVCGIDGSRSAREAARQAAALAGPATVFELLAVANDWGVGLNAAATLTKAHGRRALDEAAHDLRDSAAQVETRVVCAERPLDALIGASAGADLLAVGRHSRSRLGGMALGRTATSLVHCSPTPLLVAVAPPHGLPFPGRILVAADGPGHPERAVVMAGLITRHAGGDITLLRLEWSRRAQRPELARAIARLTELGVEPVEVLMAGIPRRRIPLIAQRERASLVVVGSRGLTGVRALDSTSERVAHDAPCSVLVLRPGASDDFSHVASS